MTPEIVGHVRSPYPDPASTPVQSTRDTTGRGRVELREEYAPMLDGLEGFDYVWLLTWLDRAERPAADGHVVPFLLRHRGEDARRLGLFATRHPARPTPIGLSVVRLLGVEGATLHVGGLDCCDGTPVLDVKPWQQQLDVPRWDEGPDAVAAIRGGWFEDADPTQVLP